MCSREYVTCRVYCQQVAVERCRHGRTSTILLVLSVDTHGPHVGDTIPSLLGANKGDECLVDNIRSFPLRDVPCLGDPDEL